MDLKVQSSAAGSIGAKVITFANLVPMLVNVVNISFNADNMFTHEPRATIVRVATTTSPLSTSGSCIRLLALPARSFAQVTVASATVVAPKNCLHL